MSNKIQAKKPVMDADLKKRDQAPVAAAVQETKVEEPVVEKVVADEAPAETQEQEAAPQSEDTGTDAAPDAAAEAAPLAAEESAPEATEVSPAAPAAVAPEAAKQEEPVVEAVSEEVTYLNNISVNGTVLQKRIHAALMNFIEAMTPGRPAQPSEIVKAQNLFLDHLLWALDRPDPSEFKQVWSVLLVGFKAYHGESNSPSKGYSALSEYRAGVFSDSWTDEDRLGCYLNLITLLRHTRNVSSRAKDIKRIKLDAISDVLVTDSRLDNLKRFYAV